MNYAKQIIAGVMIYFTIIGQLFGQAALLPNAEQQYFDNNGKPLASGTVTYYVPGTSQKKTTWTNSTQTVNNTNPVNLDIGGKGIMYGQGSYRQVVQDNLGNTIWDQPTTAFGSSSPSGATGTDTAPVGTVMAYTGFVVPTNWQLAYGQALNRTTFAGLMTAITITASGIGCTNTSTTLTGFVDTSLIRIGAPIEATCLPTSTTVASITNATTIVVSQAAAATSTVTATIFPWGNGDQVATFNVPDLRGRSPVGADCMGFVASGNACGGRLTAAFYGANPGAAGQGGGTQSKNIAIANLTPFTPTGTISTITPSGTVATTTTVTLTNNGASGTLPLAGNSTPAFNAAGVSSASTFTGNAVTPTFTGASLGSGTALSVVNPDATVNYIIKVTPNNTGAGGVVSFGGMFGDIVCDSTLTCAPIGLVNTVGCTASTLTQLGCVKPDGVTIGISGGVLSALGGPGLGTVTNVSTGTGLTGGPVTGSGTISLAQMPADTVKCNNTGSTANASDCTGTSFFDAAYCNTIGFLIVRLTGAWTCSQGIPANAVWFGADKTGVASSSTAITNMKASGASHFLFPCGTYLVTSSIQPASFQTWEGEAFRCVLINQSGLSTANGIFDLTADTVQEVRITNFGVGAFSNGRGLLSRGNFGVYVQNFICAATLLNCIDIQASATNSYRIFLDNIEVIAAASAINVGINIGTAGGANTPQGIWISNSEIANTATCGIEIFAAGGLTINTTEFLTNVGDGLCTFPSAGQTIKALFVTNSFADTNTKNGFDLTENGGTVEDVSFANVWSASNTLSGLQILTGSGHVSGLNIVGGRYVNNKQHGIVMNVGDHISIAGVQVEGNSQQGSALFDGINIAGATHVEVTGGISGAGGFASFGGSNLQRYGINIGAAADFDVISGMDLCNNVTAGLNYAASGTHNVIRDNPCYNPIGISAVTTGASPFTFTNGPTPTTVYLNGGSGVGNIAVNGVTVGNGTNALNTQTYQLEANGSVTVNFTTTAPNMTKDVH